MILIVKYITDIISAKIVNFNQLPAWLAKGKGGEVRLQVYFIKKQEKYAKANCMTTEAHFLETMKKIRF